MALNRFMHPRNIYKTPPDFKKLAESFSEFSPFVVDNKAGDINDAKDSAVQQQSSVTLNFEDPNALKALTKALLKKDFQLDVDLPVNHLIPTVPSRLNYILWIEDLLNAYNLNSVPENVWGIDIGAGACCIYGLLGARKNNWNFVVTETNDEALQYARANIEKNGLLGRITLLDPKSTPHRLVPESVLFEREYDFLMCNPPFFESEEERQQKALFKPPKSANNPVAVSDAVVEGGEVGFVTQIIRETVEAGNKIRICTAMLGKKSSLVPLKQVLTSLGLSFRTTEFCQGRTMRWGIAWSSSLDLSTAVVPNPHKNQEKPLKYVIEFGSKSETECMEICLKVIDILQKELNMYVVLDRSGKERSRWRVSALHDTWTHSRRRRRQMERGNEPMLTDHDAEGNKAADDEQYFLQFFLVANNNPLDYSLEFRWIDGKERDSLNNLVVSLRNQLKSFL